MRPTALFQDVKDIIARMLGLSAASAAADQYVSLFIWGPPGVGKSGIIKQVAAALGVGFIDIRAVLLDPVDLRGLPTIDPATGRARWAIPEFLPTEGSGILFLDEVPAAPQLTQNALLQLTLDRKLGEYTLPDGWVIVAAGNRVEDRAGAFRTSTAINNRFLHLDLEVHAEDWQDWALSSGIAPEVRSFLNSQPQKLHQFDPAQNQRAFPTPRSWEFVSRILPACTDTNFHDLVSGCIGAGVAAEFVAFAKVYRSLPDVDGILSAPATAKVPTEPDVLYAITGAITEKVRADNKKNGAAARYASRMPKEFGVLLFRDLVKVDRTTLATAEGKQFLKDNRDALIGA